MAVLSLASVNASIGAVSPILEKLGVPSIDNVLKDGKINLQKCINRDVTSEVIPVRCNLAASFGTLNKESVKMMDEKLKILIAGTVRSLQMTNDLSWQNVVSIFNQNSLMEKIAQSEINKSDQLIKDRGTGAFRFDGSPDAAIVKEVDAWFVNLIGNDQDIIQDTKIDIKLLANIVAASGAGIDSFEAFFFKKEYHEKTVVDVGILRFPDIENPFVKVYRIKLTAWSDCTRVLFVQKDISGITGQFNAMKYKPREAVMEGLKEETKKKAIAEAEDLFS